jgi:transposase
LENATPDDGIQSGVRHAPGTLVPYTLEYDSVTYPYGVERRLDHESGEAHAFYRSLQGSPEPVRVGIEATGPIHWFERLLTELGHELWIGDSAKIRASEVRKQKTDAERRVARVPRVSLLHRGSYPQRQRPQIS